MAKIPSLADSLGSPMAKDKYLGEYNNIISLAAVEFGDNFAAIASPTLSKQETVTNLYDSIQAQNCTGQAPFFPWGSIVEFIPRIALMFIQLCYASLQFRVRQLPANSIYFRSWLEPRCVQGDALIDEHFRNIPEDLSRDNNVVVSLHPYDYSLLRKVKKLNKNKNYIISVGLLSIFDIIKLIFDYIFTAHLKIKDCYNFNNRNITPAINHSLLLDYLRLRSFTAYQEKYICKNLLRFDLKAFVYVFENQSWEKACCSILKDKGFRLVGCQGSGFSPIFLNFFPTKLDAQRQPMPDVILTVGDLFTMHLLEHGNYEIPVKTFAAARFPYPNDGIRYKVSAPNPKLSKRILYAFPVHISQYIDILDDLIKAFSLTTITVDLKLHPQFRPERIQGFNSLPSNFNVIARVDMSHLSDIYDCVLFNDNSFGIESLFMGVRSYQYDATRQFDDERFFYFDLWDTHLDYDGLILLRDQLLNGCYTKNYNVPALSDYLNSMYRPYTGDLSVLLSCISRQP